MAFAFSPVVEGSRFRVLEMRGGEKGGGKREEHAPEPQNMPQAANPHLLFSLAGTTR